MTDSTDNARACVACEGTGSVSTNDKDRDGFPTEAACPECTDNARVPERINPLPTDLWISEPSYFGDGSLVPVTATNDPDWCFKHRYVRVDLAPLGAVKVKPLTEEDRAEITEAAYQAHCKHHRSGAAGQLITEWDGIESWVIQEAEARIRSALEPADVMADPRVWQPIGTAPKDTLIDIWLSDGVRWCDCYYDRICDEWRTSRPSGRLLSIKAMHVTHWMPRPASPAPARITDTGETL